MGLAAELREGGGEEGGVGGGDGAEGEADFGVDDEAGGDQGGLYRDGVGLQEERLEDRVEFAMELGGSREVIGEGVANHRADLFGEEVGGYADDAFGADGHEREGEAVVAAEHGEGVAKSGF